MLDVYFSRSQERHTLQERVVMELDNCAEVAKNYPVTLSIMLFSFTDDKIYDRLVALVNSFPSLEVSILADYSNISEDKERKIPALSLLKLPNLSVKLTSDFPYQWEPKERHFKWSYRASKGFLHHKTMCITVNGTTTTLLIGSYNWTKKSNHSYENIIRLSKSDENEEVFRCFEKEFSAIWGDPKCSLTFQEAKDQFETLVAYRQRKIEINPMSLLGAIDTSSQQRGLPLGANQKKRLIEDDRYVAFNSRPDGKNRSSGFSNFNYYRSFMMTKASGLKKQVPLNLETVTLDFIFRSPLNSTLKIAMFALSNRVPEYNALLEAARKGVNIVLVLDKKSGVKTIKSLEAKIMTEKLPFKVKLSGRMMHQKYMVNMDMAAVLTGTANMTTEAYSRHAEHRLVINNNPVFAKKFSDNFDLIWQRLP